MNREYNVAFILENVFMQISGLKFVNFNNANNISVWIALQKKEIYRTVYHASISSPYCLINILAYTDELPPPTHTHTPFLKLEC